MTYWIELMCDIRARGCATNKNNSPGVLCRTFAMGKAHLRADAKERGWKRQGANWICPACQRARVEVAEARGFEPR